MFASILLNPKRALPMALIAHLLVSACISDAPHGNHVLSARLAGQTPIGDDYMWLEDVEGERALSWVREHNAKTVSVLEAHPMFGAVHEDVSHIVYAKDRVPFSHFSNGYFWNFWQDDTYEHGIIRRTTQASYAGSAPVWETILDLDALSKTENENWVYEGAERLDTFSSRRLLHLSRGGTDAVVVREFDYASRTFIADGFNIPQAKTQVTALDENKIFVGTDFGPGSLTDSGYPRIVKLWNRGEPLEAARVVFEGQSSDVSAGAYVLRDDATKHVVFYRSLDFHNSALFLQEAGAGPGAVPSIRQLPVPCTATILAIRNNQIYVQLKEAHKAERQFATNSIIRFGLKEPSLEKAEVIFTAADGQSLEAVSVRKDRVFVTLLDNIRSRVLELAPDKSGAWTQKTLPFPTTGIISFDLKDERYPSDITTMTYTDHLTPQKQFLVHDEDGSYRLDLLKASPDCFDSAKFEVVQNFATSKDGTQVPYFVLRPKNFVEGGNYPTILYGYGGFEISLTPAYSASIGKVWLERGGVYVIANIRGGGEFGPAWHQAALKENRQRAFDDFIAVAEDLQQRKITTPARLGIKGGSNGGLLMGAVMTQRPELFNAVLAQVPLLDMLRFSKLLAGASWIGEYGDPEIPEEGAYLAKYSPFHNVHANKQYPVPLFTTSTKDDRVHPGHARKMAARMEELGHPVHYYENINGGHAGAANLKETAYVNALEYTYLLSKLAP